MLLFRKKKESLNKTIPQHIAIIMDGNGRWAQKRSLPRTAGHSVGAENIRKILKECKNLGVSYLTVYAFSTENWKRSKEEVNTIMRLLIKFMKEAADRSCEENYRVRVFGDVGSLPEELIKNIYEAEQKSEKNEKFNLNICINYGGRKEVINAVKNIVSDGISVEDIDEDTISSRLYSKGIPDPDLIIRSGGEMRTSNFLMWQSVYSELYFTNVLWPDFSVKELHKAIEEYGKRSRRYGGQ